MKQLLWAIIVASFVTATSVFAGETEYSSIEVGFSQDGEPEPHLLVVAEGEKVTVYQLAEGANRVIASTQGREMPTDIYMKRLSQAVDENGFFSARQVREKRRCHDAYVLRIKVGIRVRERKGCGIQGNDPFAAFSQNFFKDAFVAWRRK